MKQLPIKIYIAPSKIPGSQRGIFAAQKILPNEIIERCPVMTVPSKQRKTLQQTNLVNYYFLWGKSRKQAAIALGYGSLYNHSFKPNAKYVKRIYANRIDFIAIEPIKEGDEITINYNGNPENETPLKYHWANKDNN